MTITPVALVTALRKYQDAGYDVTLGQVLAHLDQRGQGVACGSSWITPRKKCSKDKAKTTSKANLAKTKEKAKAAHALKSQAKRKMTRPDIQAEEAAKKVKEGSSSVPKSKFKSRAAVLTIAEAREIPPSDLKKGQKVKFLEYGRINDKEVMDVQERDMVITSVNTAKGYVTAKPANPNAGGQRPTSKFSYGKNGFFDGTMHSASSQPEAAHKLKQAQKAEQEIEGFRSQLSAAEGRFESAAKASNNKEYLEVSSEINYARGRIKSAEENIRLGEEALKKIAPRRDGLRLLVFPVRIPPRRAA